MKRWKSGIAHGLEAKYSHPSSSDNESLLNTEC